MEMARFPRVKIASAAAKQLSNLSSLRCDSILVALEDSVELKWCPHCPGIEVCCLQVKPVGGGLANARRSKKQGAMESCCEWPTKITMKLQMFAAFQVMEALFVTVFWGSNDGILPTVDQRFLWLPDLLQFWNQHPAWPRRNELPEMKEWLSTSWPVVLWLGFYPWCYWLSLVIINPHQPSYQPHFSTTQAGRLRGPHREAIEAFESVGKPEAEWMKPSTSRKDRTGGGKLGHVRCPVYSLGYFRDCCALDVISCSL